MIEKEIKFVIIFVGLIVFFLIMLLIILEKTTGNIILKPCHYCGALMELRDKTLINEKYYHAWCIMIMEK